MWFKHSMSIAQQLMPIYNTNVKNNDKSNVAFNVAQPLRASCHKGTLNLFMTQSTTAWCSNC